MDPHLVFAMLDWKSAGPHVVASAPIEPATWAVAGSSWCAALRRMVSAA